MRRTARNGRRSKGSAPLRLSTIEKAVLIGAVVAFVVLSYFLIPAGVRRMLEHERAHRPSAPETGSKTRAADTSRPAK
jgi:hypothetical protein